MKNVEKMLGIFTGDSLLRNVKELLGQRDGEFAVLEQACRTAADQLGGLAEMLALRDRQLSKDLWFAAWQGLKLNLEVFRSPVGLLLMELDFNDLYREHQLITMPSHRDAIEKINAMLAQMDQRQREMLDPVDEFYAHLETVGLKVAHYLGFRLGDMLFPMAEPGYVPDLLITQTYRSQLERYIGFSLE